MSDLLVDWCSHEAAKYAVMRWHYSKRMPTPPITKIGVWENGVFIGCVLFSRGATDALGKPYGLTITEVCELTRIALDAHSAFVSCIIAKAIALLKSHAANLRLIVSYADPEKEHVGVVYQASNWLYTGRTASDAKYKDKNGKLWHSRQVSRTGVKKQYGKFRHVPKIDDCEKIPTSGKHRYLYPLDRAMRRQIALLAKPYPKHADA